MRAVFKILKYNLFDVLRSKWTIIYTAFFLLTASGLFYLSSSVGGAITSLMNVVVTIIPLVSIVFGSMYYYNGREFAELILAQPVKRNEVFLGQYLGLSMSLLLAFLVGMLVPFFAFGIFQSPHWGGFMALVGVGSLLTLAFSAIACWIAARNNDKIRGFGISLLVWLLMAVVYDGIILMLLAFFQDYPLEAASIALSVSNPVDLGRILVLLKLDISALMGYTGAVFNEFFGSGKGILVSAVSLLLWIALPLGGFIYTSRKKDY